MGAQPVQSHTMHLLSLLGKVQGSPLMARHLKLATTRNLDIILHAVFFFFLNCIAQSLYYFVYGAVHFSLYAGIREHYMAVFIKALYT